MIRVVAGLLAFTAFAAGVMVGSVVQKSETEDGLLRTIAVHCAYGANDASIRIKGHEFLVRCL